MESSPLVSVLIPNFNYGRFLHRCIDSVLTQTYSNIEMIVYDDGSSDHSPEILESYGDRIVSILRQNHGKGHAANQIHAINQAFAKSSGEIICLLDSDDTFEMTKVDRIVEIFATHDDIVAVENFGHYTDASDHKIRPYDRKLLPFSDRDGYISQQELISKIRADQFPFMGLPTSFLSFKRQFMQAFMPLPEDGANACFIDLRISCRVPLAGGYFICTEPLSNYRVHGNNNFYGRPANTFLRCMIQSCRYGNSVLRQHSGKGVFFWLSRPMLRFYRIYVRKLRAQFKHWRQQKLLHT